MESPTAIQVHSWQATVSKQLPPNYAIMMTPRNSEAKAKAYSIATACPTWNNRQLCTCSNHPNSWTAY